MDGENINEIIEILNNALYCSFSFNGITWVIKPYSGLPPIELCFKEILVFYKIENEENIRTRTFFQVYSVEVYNKIFANRLAFE